MNIGLAIEKAIRTLLLTLCQLVYSMIVFFFNIFEKIGTASIIGDEFVTGVYERVGLILGLFMIFRITFSAIQYIINPDLLMDKKSGVGNIVKKAFIVIALLGITPYLFQLAFKVQNIIIDEDVLPKILVGSTADTDNFGINLAEYTFFNFYTRNPIAGDLCGENQYNAIKYTFHNSGDLSMAKNCIELYDDKKDVWAINFDYHGLLPLIVGCLLLWMIVMYTLQVAVRAFQLAYLQLIAPVPIMLYLDPKNDEQLKKWFKQCTTTYFDFFIRVAVIYFVVFVIEIIMSQDFFNTIDVSGGSFFSNFYISLVLIIALLVFAKKVPDLFKELFPSAGGAAKFGFGLNPKKVLNDTWAASLIGGTVGALGAGASNAVHGYMNMRKAWNKNPIDKKWSNLTLGEKKELKNSGIDMNAYNARRRAQMSSRFGAVAGATGKAAFSVAGGVLGGAKAGLKTKDITKTGEAIKTSNKNREERELRAEAGYHWYNPLPAIGDKVLEFAGESGDTIKNRNQAIRDIKQRESDLAEGERLYKAYAKSDGKLDAQRAFKSDAYKVSYSELTTAKKEAKNAEITLSQEQANLNAAYNYTGADREEVIAKAQERYNVAYGNAKATQGKLELAKAKHDSNKKIYPNDAKVEDLFKYYSDLNSPLASFENPVPQQNVSRTVTNTDNVVLGDYIDDEDDNRVTPSIDLSFGSNPQRTATPGNRSHSVNSQSEQQPSNTKQIAFKFSLNKDGVNKTYSIPLDISDSDLRKIVDGVDIETLEEMVRSADNSFSSGMGKNEDRNISSKKHHIWTVLEGLLDEKREKQRESTHESSTDNNANDFDVFKMSKSELKKLRIDLERRRIALSKRYEAIDRNKQMGRETIDTAEFSKISAELQEIDRKLEKINSALNTL